MKKDMYIIKETIQRADGSRVYAVNKIIGELFGAPILEEVYRGTESDCKKYIEDIKE